MAVENTTTAKWWGGSSFNQSSADYLAASGATSWTYALAASNLTPGDGYSVVAQATDEVGNVGISTTASFTYQKLDQTISFTSTNPSPATPNSPNYTPTATSTSGLTVAITLDASSTGCTLTSGVVDFTAAGTCVIDANQAGNASYNAAAQMQQSVTVTALTILSLHVTSTSFREVTFSGNGASGSSRVTVTVCSSNSFPCSGGNTVSTVQTGTSPSNPWTTGNTSFFALTAGTQYYAQATQGSATSPVFPFIYESTEPVPTNIVLANGGTSGKADAGDTVTVTFSEPLDASTICSTWVNDGTTQSISNATISITHNSNSTLTASAPTPTCSGNGNFGTTTLGAEYTSTATISFTKFGDLRGTHRQTR